MTKVSLLNHLRKLGYTDLSKLGSVEIDGLGQPVFKATSEGEGFKRDIQRDFLFDPDVTVKSRIFEADQRLLSEVLGRSHDWINARLGEPLDKLLGDPDYMRARRLIMNLQAPREED